MNEITQFKKHVTAIYALSDYLQELCESEVGRHRQMDSHTPLQTAFYLPGGADKMSLSPHERTSARAHKRICASSHKLIVYASTLVLSCSRGSYSACGPPRLL